MPMTNMDIWERIYQQLVVCKMTSVSVRHVRANDDSVEGNNIAHHLALRRLLRLAYNGATRVTSDGHTTHL